MNVTIPETIILVRNPDGDLIGAIRPIDPFNPDFTRDEIERLSKDLSCEIVTVESFADYRAAFYGD